MKQKLLMLSKTSNEEVALLKNFKKSVILDRDNLIQKVPISHTSTLQIQL